MSNLLEFGNLSEVLFGQTLNQRKGELTGTPEPSSIWELDVSTFLTSSSELNSINIKC